MSRSAFLSASYPKTSQKTGIRGQIVATSLRGGERHAEKSPDGLLRRHEKQIRLFFHSFSALFAMQEKTGSHLGVSLFPRQFFLISVVLSEVV